MQCHGKKKFGKFHLISFENVIITIFFWPQLSTKTEFMPLLTGFPVTRSTSKTFIKNTNLEMRLQAEQKREFMQIIRVNTFGVMLLIFSPS